MGDDIDGGVWMMMEVGGESVKYVNGVGCWLDGVDDGWMVMRLMMIVSVKYVTWPRYL